MLRSAPLRSQRLSRGALKATKARKFWCTSRAAPRTGASLALTRSDGSRPLRCIIHHYFCYETRCRRPSLSIKSPNILPGRFPCFKLYLMPYIQCLGEKYKQPSNKNVNGMVDKKFLFFSFRNTQVQEIMNEVSKIFSHKDILFNKSFCV